MKKISATKVPSIPASQVIVAFVFLLIICFALLMIAWAGEAIFSQLSEFFDRYFGGKPLPTLTQWVIGTFSPNSRIFFLGSDARRLYFRVGCGYRIAIRFRLGGHESPVQSRGLFHHVVVQNTLSARCLVFNDRPYRSTGIATNSPKILHHRT